MIRNLINLKNINIYHIWLLSILFFVAHIPAIFNNHGNVNAYVLFTQALLDGKLYLPQIEGYHYLDLIHFEGKYYLPYPPFPAIFLLPFAAVFGAESINPVLVCMLLTCVNFFIFYTILKRLNISGENRLWMILAFFFGTGYWFVLITSHHVYGFAHISCITMILLGMSELFGKRRGWIIGICLGGAFLSRQMSVFTGILFLYILIEKEIKKEKPNFTNPISFALSSCMFLFIYFWYNYTRFGDFMNTGYEYIAYIEPMKARVEEYGVFSLKYFLFNFYTMFIKGHNIHFTGEGLLNIKGMDLFGSSLISASPFVLFAFRTNWKKGYVISTVVAIIIILTGLLLYHNNGFHQVNTNRFALDFMPILFLLIVHSLAKIPTWLIRFTVSYAIVINIISFIIHMIYQ
ncbi:hypothetical protein R9C00_29575 (plasmid) [Flammeovirgaceae bacterium SG7u.111]|nr:hypothetical protein [Flammeovirgaceae bacterium SG7u.132]WPO38836.1 hypothetical protein R9C00_29575 [Flammeovirgaceae bacterium SG7u.111]